MRDWEKYCAQKRYEEEEEVAAVINVIAILGLGGLMGYLLGAWQCLAR